MRLRADPASQTDRVASTAAAFGVTIATALLILTSAPSRFTPLPTPVATHEAERAADRITYVSPVAVPTLTHVRSAVRTNTRPQPRSHLASPTREQVTPPPRQAVVPDSSAGTPAAPGQRRPAESDFERRWTAHGVSPLLLPGGSREPAYAGAATAPGAIIHLPDSQVDRDAQLRAQAQEDIAARAAGSPMPTTPRGGISIDAPLPFGGPSRAQRQRDSTINAQTKAILVRVRHRLDSIAAARKQQHADSLGRDDKQR